MQKPIASIAVLIFILFGCTVGPPTKYHDNPDLAESEVAVIKTQGNRGWISAISFGIPETTNSYFHHIDNRLAGIWETRVEVLPGSHTYILSLQTGDGWGYYLRAICDLEFSAEAGEQYIIKVQHYEYYDGARHRGYYIWAENDHSGERVAGTEPSGSDRPPDGLTCREGEPSLEARAAARARSRPFDDGSSYTTTRHHNIRVIDGETLEWNGQTFRLWGIDAIELEQQCRSLDGTNLGLLARHWLWAQIAGTPHFHCVTREHDEFERAIAQCFVGEPGEYAFDVADLLVYAGLAWPTNSGGYYADLQAEGREDGTVGTLTDCDPPWEWRAAQGQ